MAPGQQRSQQRDDGVVIPAICSILTPDGVSISYRDYRPDGPVRATSMLVHGLASSGLQFDRDAQYLQQHGYRVLVPDLRGRDVFVCGPDDWMASVEAALDVAGLPREQLHSERFTW